MNKSIIAAMVLAPFSACMTSAQADAGSRADSHAPIAVMGDHLHQQGEWMLSYRYMTMDMSGIIDNSQSSDYQSVLEDYMVAPRSMTMAMHMLGAMYAPSDNLTLMAMLPWLNNEMDHTTRMGMDFSTQSSGLGDIKLSALINASKGEGYNSHFTVGVSLPTADIEQRDMTPAGDAKLPYPMQLGSGTYDLLASYTFNGQLAHGSYGVQANSVTRSGENDQGYRLGNQYDISGWYAWSFNHHWSASLRTSYKKWHNIQGADADLNPMMVPTADPKLRAGSLLDLSLGLNYLHSSGHRLAFEFAKPIEQKSTGPQLKHDWSWTFGWQKAF